MRQEDVSLLPINSCGMNKVATIGSRKGETDRAMESRYAICHSIISLDEVAGEHVLGSKIAAPRGRGFGLT